MSYISNGCNDCSAVDFGATGVMNGGNSTNFLNPPQNTMYENTQQNQFIYQQPQQPQVQQQVQQPVQQPVLQQQQPQVQQKYQQAPKPVQGLPPQQYNQNKNNTNNNNNGIQHVLGSYLLDNGFTLIVAFVVASAWHTTIKYYIDQAIKFNGGTPTYYIVYAVIATILSIFLSTMKS
jgi:hypothetical protein